MKTAMEKFPCVDCVTLAICKGVIKVERIDETLIIQSLINKCELFEDFLFKYCVYEESKRKKNRIVKKKINAMNKVVSKVFDFYDIQVRQVVESKKHRNG